VDPKGLYILPSSLGLGEARRRVEEGAVAEGFRVLQVHDVQAILRERGFSADPTIIVEVCSASLASESLALDPRTALMMPCKVVIQEKVGEVLLSTLLPETAVGGKAVKALAARVGAKLKRVVESAAGLPVPANAEKAGYDGSHRPAADAG
jgi:uncharacterized protein (DUF302 family)